MGELYYAIGKKSVVFNEESDTGCLCTFPHNDNGIVDIDRLKSLALFGAAVQLILKGHYDSFAGEYVVIPDDLPEYILHDVENLCKNEYDNYKLESI